MTSNPEEQGTTEAAAAAKETEAPKKARVAPRRAHVASSKPKLGKKPTPAKKSTKAPKKAKSRAEGVREGSKTAKVLDLLKRPGGATTKELIKATGWQPHSLRGFLSGTVRKKMGLAITSTNGDDGERSYSVKA